VIVKAEERLLDAEMLEENSAVAGILGRDQVGSLQNFNGPQCDVLSVSDGCWNNT
jgi:hypothetical protein